MNTAQGQAPADTNTASGAADLTDTVCKALRRAWQLGQTYWQQADSESFAIPHKKSDETQAKFNRLVDDTRAALASAPAQPVAEPTNGTAYAELPDERAVFEAWYIAQVRSKTSTANDWSDAEIRGAWLSRSSDAYRASFAAQSWEAWQARASRGQAPAQAAPAYKDSTPELHIGDSAFESWYSTYSPLHKSDKQRARDAYTAGMGDPLVTAALAKWGTPAPVGVEPLTLWIDEVRQYLVAAADSSMSRNNSEQLASELLDQMPLAMGIPAGGLR